MSDLFSYPESSNSTDFQNVLSKYEFSSNAPNKKKSFIYQEPNQILLRNFISLPTIYENVLLYQSLGTGKCHKKDTPILMYDGAIKNVQDVEIGDYLMGDDSTPRKVLSLARGTDIMYDIISANGEKYTVNQEHILCLKASGFPMLKNNIKQKNYQVRWIENNKINSKKFTYHSVNKNQQQCFTEANNFYKSIENNEQILELTVKDYLNLPKSTKALLKGYKHSVEFPSRPVPSDPYIIGFSISTSIPNIYKCNDRQTRLKLLAGILDAHACYSKGKFELSHSIQEPLLNDIIYLSRSLGLAYNKNCIYGKGIEDIPTVTPHKITKLLTDVLLTNLTVEEVGEGDYYGFTLDGNCRYLMGDFTVTHNTCSSISIAEGFKEYVTNMGRKIVVLVKNKNIQRNFVNELLSKCTQDEYVTQEQRNLYFGNSSNKTLDHQVKRKELVNKVHRLINKSYHFITYGAFVNRVLGAKEFEKDELGRNTSKVIRKDGEIQRKRAKNLIKNLNNTVIIIDEAHNVTNNDVYTALYQVLSRSYNFRLVLLTATPMYDNPKEIFEISNLLNCNNYQLKLPIRNDLFKPTATNEILVSKTMSPLINNSVLKGGIVGVTPDGINRLRNSLYGKVSYLKANTETNPTKIVVGKELVPNHKGTTNVVYCKMSKHQYVTYLEALKIDAKSDNRYDIASLIQNIESAENVNETTTVSKSSSLYKNSSDASTMSYPNKLYGKDGFLSIFSKTTGAGYTLNTQFANVLTTDLKKYSAKLFKLLENINASPGNVFVYSNYVSYGGTSLVKQLLLHNGYKEFRSKNTQPYKSFVLFDESTNIETREKYLRIFNSSENKHGKLIKILIGSPIISEGITLKNVRQVHILEPSWNMSRINQIIGRAVRNYSHHALPEDERNVSIYKYVSVYVDSLLTGPQKSSLLKFFIDREKYVLSEEKDRQNKVVERMLKEISFDCSLMKPRNTILNGEAGSPECDYQDCEFQCAVPMPKEPFDKSTYNLNIQFFEQFDIQFTTNILRDLFKKYFIWHLSDILSYIHEIDKNISKETIFATLGHITTNKILFTDPYNRDGFIINKGDYYIFNSTDIDINSSIYSKILDFSVDKSKYTLSQFIQTKFNIDPKNKNNNDAKSAQKKEPPKLSDSDINFNNHIINNNTIFGTYRQRGTKTSPFGHKDGKFRIVEKNTPPDDDEDKRKIVSGMWIGSYKKPQLLKIANLLKLSSRIPLEEFDKDQLGRLIEKHLLQSNLVLK
jgi:superfamily II DNA or RNA helicase